MKIRILGCNGGQLPGKKLTAFLLNGDLLIDAGTVAVSADMKAQRAVKNILLSHAHLDHIGAMPFYAVNISNYKNDSVKIFGSQHTINAVQQHLMNGVTWPDYSKINNPSIKPVFKYSIIEQNKWIVIGDYKVMAIPVNHTIPTIGFLIGKGSEYILYSGDTKDTEALWVEAKKLGKKLKAAFIEVTFPDSLHFLAEKTCHLTPKTLENQLKKMLPIIPKIYVYHLKPQHQKEIIKDLKKIKHYKITVLENDLTYKI